MDQSPSNHSPRCNNRGAYALRPDRLVDIRKSEKTRTSPDDYCDRDRAGFVTSIGRKTKNAQNRVIHIDGQGICEYWPGEISARATRYCHIFHYSVKEKMRGIYAFPSLDRGGPVAGASRQESEKRPTVDIADKEGRLFVCRQGGTLRS